MKKQTLLLLALLLTVTPVFASGTGFENAGFFLGMMIFLYFAPVFLSLLISIINLSKKSKTLAIIGWILTFISFGITSTFCFTGDVELMFLIILPILSTVLLIKGELAKKNRKTDNGNKVDVRFARSHLLLPIMIYAVINIGISLLSQFFSGQLNTSSSTMDTIALLSIVIKATLLVWLTRKVLIRRRAQKKELDIWHGILYGLIIFLPAGIYNIVGPYILMHKFFSRYFLLVLLSNSVYAVISGVIAYYLLPQKKEDQQTADITT